MGKPKGRNAFFQFLLHTQKELKKENKNYNINDQRLQEIAGQQWKDMSKEEREPFDSRSRAERERRSEQQIQVVGKSYNERQVNFGRLLSQESQIIDDESGKEEYLEKMVECCVRACPSKDELMNASFFIVGTNVMMKTDDNKYYPLEIGICRYSIAKGIQFTYHEFIDAGPVPIGYMRTAKEWSEVSHKIPLSDFSPATNNYKKIVEDMIQILEESRFTNEFTGQPTPMLVYSMAEETADQNRGVFQWLANQYKQFVPDFEWDLEVLDLVNLVFHVSKSVDQPIVPALAQDHLTSSAFDYSVDTNCDYHEELDNRNCAQGMARRLCYMLSQDFCDMFGVKPTENHLPGRRHNVIAETYLATLHDVKPTPANRYVHNHSDKPDDDWTPAKAQPKAESSSRPDSRAYTPLGIGRGRGLLKDSLSKIKRQ